MADDFKRVPFDITQPIKGVPMIKAGESSLFLNKPDRIVKVSDNEVYAVYGKYKQTITAEGVGNERYNFTEKITEVGK